MTFLDSNTLVIIIVPAIILPFLAQLTVQSAVANASGIEAKMSGYAAARHMLDGSGLYDVKIEQVPGHLSNHYDARHEMLQLSPDIYHGRNLAAVATAAHEAGHAIQHSQRSRLLMAVRNVAVPLASFGSGAGILLAVMGLICRFPPLLATGILLFSGAVFFQLVNLPGEFDASVRARRMLVNLGVVDVAELPHVKRVLYATALTYLAATLQSVLTLVHRVISLVGGRRDP